MGMTLTEKILARHAGRKSVAPGENIWVNVDVLMTHDVCGPGTIGVFQEEFGAKAKVFDPEKIVIIPDHYIFTADPKAHRNIQILRQFVKDQGIRYYYDPDFVAGDGMPAPYADPKKTPYKGVCHVALPEEGHTRPGEVLLGTDSHTCTHGAVGAFATGIGNTDAGFVMGTGKLWLKVPPTMRFVFEGEVPPYLMGKDMILHVIGDISTAGATYRAMEFAGQAVEALNMDERMTICNMAIEAGGKNGIIAPDARTIEFVKSRTDKPFEPVTGDRNATYLETRTYDASKLEPTVAQPHSPDRRALARELTDVKLDRSYIGSCTGGKITDFVAAAYVLKGRTVAIETFIVPATTEVDAALDTLKVDGESLRSIFQAAGCTIGPASCAACLGGPHDTFGRANAPLKVIATTNRNFPGRMGSKDAGVFLASPLTAAASAVAGHVADPRDYFDRKTPIGTGD
ncbi:MAG: 3-isopropylmalate dehydratase large subunit [Planctomycetes bacterium]|nr:3-isopropylmalate dehydratase large subunit [Planctomycetota bacterium]